MCRLLLRELHERRPYSVGCVGASWGWRSDSFGAIGVEQSPNEARITRGPLRDGNVTSTLRQWRWPRRGELGGGDVLGAIPVLGPIRDRNHGVADYTRWWQRYAPCERVGPWRTGNFGINEVSSGRYGTSSQSVATAAAALIDAKARGKHLIEERCASSAP